MKKLSLACSLALFAAAPVFSDQGCIEFSTTTVTTTICNQFDCNQRVGGKCVLWSCGNSQTNTYIDTETSGCSRVANCGKKAVFDAGEPATDPETDSNEICDWYPCMQTNPITKVCLTYLCVSKRVFQTVRTTYPNALCVPVYAPVLVPPSAGNKPEKQQKKEPPPAKIMLQTPPPLN